ncbi:hypothetical protein LC613_30355 [Nostoc sphaeroides CHAB 2801]|uniref:hypothetical protein n=1 Tax=Nostoc sphaeroides TaxID=446679 RepID=UPI001E6329C2|nr:hypothetical protein [Nostoc sphaeroides]MCC5631991.1 hypothetical protein [Nostoc sphaeroides CHAB 2801]
MSVPLSICLTLSDRTLLTYGEFEGNRNNAGYKLARNLLGTSNLLTRNRIAYHPEPRQLFDRYCDIAVHLHLNQLRRIQFGTVRIKQQPLPVGILALSL